MQQDPQVIRQSIEQALQESLSLQGGKMQTISLSGTSPFTPQRRGGRHCRRGCLSGR